MDTDDMNELVPCCRIYCTVVSGFESTAIGECRERFQNDISRIASVRGALRFTIPVVRVPELIDLRSVDNLYVVLLECQKQFSEDMEEAMVQVQEIANRPDVAWETGFLVWKTLKEKLEPKRYVKNQLDIPKNFSTDSSYNPAYRATCYRSGQHCFTSQKAMAIFGGALNTTFDWKVDLSNYDVEVVLIIDGEEVSISLTLTEEPLFKRNIVYFGPTTLRSTIAYNMIRLGELQPGDVVCDPMCGSGSIPLEAAMAFPKSYIICGDNFPSAGEKTLLNAQEMERKRGRNLQNLDVLQWDIVGSPLRPGSVDVWISDFPFGKRHKCDRRTLYPKALTAMAEASKVGVSRAVILTMDRRAMSQAVKSRKHWHIKRMVNINVGGLSACVYSMVRTCFV